MNAHFAALETVEAIEREALLSFVNVEPDKRDPLLNALLSGDESILRAFENGDEGFDELDEADFVRRGDEMYDDEIGDEDEVQEVQDITDFITPASLSSPPQVTKEQPPQYSFPHRDDHHQQHIVNDNDDDGDDDNQPNTNQNSNHHSNEGISEEIVLELIQQLGLDRLPDGYDPRIDQLPLELRLLIYEQLDLAREMRSPSPNSNSGAAAVERDGYMYRQASYAEDLHRYVAT